MTLLREEFIKNKKEKENIVSEAAIDWLFTNVVIINEKLDRKSVSRLIDSIQKFESTFGPYKEKIPSIAKHLEAAELDLQMIITGKVNSNKTSNSLKQLSYLYSTFSNFFTRDLPILLKTKIFQVAKEKPKQPIDSLPSINQAGVKQDLILIRDALAHAMSPSKEEKKLLGKIYSSSSLPKLNVGKIASELLSLTYNDLEKLTEIGKVPMATTPIDNKSEKIEEPEISTESKNIFGENLHEHLLSENRLNEVSMQEVGNVLQQAYQVVKSVGLSSLEEPLNNLHSQIAKYLASSIGEKAKQALSQVADKKTGLLDLFKTPGGNLLQQANMAIETLKALGNAWPKVQNLINKPDFTESDMENIKKILVNQVKGGALKQIGSMFKTKAYPGLSPEEIVDALTLGESIAYQKIELLERKLSEAPVDAEKDLAAAKATFVAPVKNMQQGIENLKKSLSALQNFASGNMQSSEPSATTQKAPGDKSVAGQQNPIPPTNHQAAPIVGTQSPDTEKTQRVLTKTVDYPDIEKKSKELGINADQLEKALTWVGVKVLK